MPSGKAMLAGAVALVAIVGGGAAVLAAGDFEDEPAPRASSVATDPPATEQQPEPVPEAVPPAPPEEREADEPEVAPQHEPGTEPRPGGKPQKTRFRRERRKDPARHGKRFAVPPAQQFSGTGNALIGTVDVKAPAVVKWRARGRFGLEFGREAYPIVAPSRRGELVIPPYRFELVRVLAKGRWTITVTPQR
jgi:outer membrane biosynthesis protein TonB